MTGQEREALEKAFEVSSGQPWAGADLVERASFKAGYDAALAVREEPLREIDERRIHAAGRALAEKLHWFDDPARADELGRVALEAAREEPPGEIDDREWTAYGEREGAIQAAAEKLKGIYPNEFADNFYFYQQAKAVVDAYRGVVRDTKRPDAACTCLIKAPPGSFEHVPDCPAAEQEHDGRIENLKAAHGAAQETLGVAERELQEALYRGCA